MKAVKRDSLENRRRDAIELEEASPKRSPPKQPTIGVSPRFATSNSPILNLNTSSVKRLPHNFTMSQMKQRSAAKRKGRQSHLGSASSVGKKSKKSQSPRPDESPSASKAAIFSQAPSQKKMGRYTVHVRSGTNVMGANGGGSSFRDLLNEES